MSSSISGVTANVIHETLVTCRYPADGMLLAEQVQLHDVVLEQQRDGPVEHNAQPPLPARHLKQVIRPPHEPRGEAAEFQLHDSSDAVVMSKRSERAERAVDKGLGGRAVDGCDDVFRDNTRF